MLTADELHNWLLFIDLTGNRGNRGTDHLVFFYKPSYPVSSLPQDFPQAGLMLAMHVCSNSNLLHNLP
jgi:hypothetical protein